MGQSGIAPRPPLHDGVVEQLREMIVRCELKPGERLSETDIGRIFQVSRTPLREALKLLAAERLVDIRPHRGAVIAEISLQEVAQAFDVLAVLEEMAGPLVCDQISNRDIAELESIVDQMDVRRAQQDMKGYFRLNKQFHATIIELTGNEVLMRIYSDLYDRVQRARYLVNENSQRWQESSEEHHRIINALRLRDGAAVRQQLRDHCVRTAHAVIERLGQTLTPATKGALPPSNHQPVGPLKSHQLDGADVSP